MRKYAIRVFEKLKHFVRIAYRRVHTPAIPRNKDGKVYLHLGSGLVSGSEFTNIDVLPMPNIHYIQDITILPQYEDESVDLVYACHVVEHLPRKKLVPTLREWRRVLKPGATLRIAVPEFPRLLEVYAAAPGNVDVIQDQVLGQDPPYNNHYTLWSYEKAERVLTEAGFTNIRRWDPATAAHHGFSDRATRTMRAGEREVLVSLNVEADRP